MPRIYKSSAIYDARIANMRNLFEPSREYMGRPVERPNYLVTVIIKKTRANWYEEPALSSFSQSCQELYNAALSHIPFAQVMWPIKDGDVVEVGRVQTSWMVGNWYLNGSSSSPIEVSINNGGVMVPLRGPDRVKPGDHVSITTAIAVKTNDPRGVKCYINKVAFLAEGEEIAVGNSVSNAQLMEQAKAQGLNVTGFGGGGAPPSHGFGQAGTGGPGAAPVGFGQAGTAGPGATPPWQNGPLPGVAPPPVQPPQQGGGFAPPGGFNAPTGFPPRQ